MADTLLRRRFARTAKVPRAADGLPACEDSALLSPFLFVPVQPLPNIPAGSLCRRCYPRTRP